MKIELTHYKYKTGLVSKKQAGLSLVELLISSLIGIFLVAGLITNFMGTKESEKVRSAISEMDSNARTAMDVLRQTVGHAGYKSIYLHSGFTKGFYSESDGNLTDVSCPDGAEMLLNSFNFSTEATSLKQTLDNVKNDDEQVNDQITVVYLADNPCAAGVTECKPGGLNGAKVNPSTELLVYSDCAGGGSDKKARTVSCSADPIGGISPPTQGKIYNSFFIEDKALTCIGTAAGQKLELVENIENMQILYGVTEGTGDTAKTRYLNAKDVDDAALWANVVSVQIALLMRSENENVLKTDSDNDKYMLLGQQITVTDLRRLYRVYSTTIRVENIKSEPIT